jgi:hypothetical protein
MSTLEQCFNPDWDDIARREDMGKSAVPNYKYVHLKM